MMKVDFTADVYFCHQQLTVSIIDSQSLKMLEYGLKGADTFTEPLKQAYTNRVMVDALFSFLKNAHVPSIEEVLARNTDLVLGLPVWIEGAFYFKGVNIALNELAKGIKPSYFNFERKLDGSSIHIFGKLNSEHLFSTSASVALSGKQRKFLFGTIRNIEKDKIEIRPFFVGDRLIVSRYYHPFNSSDLEVDIVNIDQFARIGEIDRADKSLNLNNNKSIPEHLIKQYFAEIIGERHIEKDWGGESSDLFTHSLHINGKKVKSAFLFKGPSRFHPMKITDLGKNGDQVGRLFEEPADLFVVQHCHSITAQVIKHVVAFASRFDRISRYCIIDGIDTQRILRAYGKIT